MKKILSVLLISLLILSSIPVVFALIPIEPKETTVKPTPTPTPDKQPDEYTTTKIVYEGQRTITSVLTSTVTEKGKAELSDYEKSVVLTSETSKVMNLEKYPVEITTEIKIDKYRCDEKLGICGYWITALRNGYPVSTNSPIWISPPPYNYIVNSVYDPIKNEETITVKESPKEALMQILKQYADRQPLGKPIIGTKE